MGNYKALFVGEQKVKSTFWRSREDAAKRIVEGPLSVVSVYERRGDTQHFFDVSNDIAKIIKDTYGMQLPETVRSFLLKAAT